MADGSPAKAQRAIVAGYAVRELEDGQIKIEGQAPMSRSAANLFLAEAALSLARFNEPKPPQLDRDDSHDFDDLDALFAAGVDL